MSIQGLKFIFKIKKSNNNQHWPDFHNKKMWNKVSGFGESLNYVYQASFLS